MGYIFEAMTRAGDEPAPISQADGPGGNDSIPFAKLDPPAAAGMLRAPEVDDRLLAITEPSGAVAEQYRAIRTGMLARLQQWRHLVHTVTSALPQEGKTITSLNLGLCFAELADRKTLVLEADFRNPRFENLLGLESSPGLTGLLDGKAQYSEVTHAVGPHGLHVLPAGKCHSDRVVQLLSSKGMETLLKSLRQRYDHIIVDTPAVIGLADAGVVGAMSDDVMLIVRMGQTSRVAVERAVRALESYNATVNGVIAAGQQDRAGVGAVFGHEHHVGHGHDSAHQRLGTGPGLKAAA